MLPIKVRGERGPLIFMLHWLGGSADTWTEVSEALAARGFHCIALDLPGFGRAVDVETFSVSEMADAVIRTIRFVRGGDTSSPWLLAGHSMGGKLSAVIARRAADGVAGLEQLAGLVLVSPSPAGVEPMPENKRKEALEHLGQSTGDPARDYKNADRFVLDNVGRMPLLNAIQQRTTNDVLRMNRAALRTWMTVGSKEDWAARVGALDLPAVILAGTEEASLGPDAQRKHTLPHVPNAAIIPLEGSSHLSPLERPWELVEHITEFARRHHLRPVPQAIPLDARTAGLIGSSATSPQTRDVLNARLGAEPVAITFDVAEVRILRALVRRVLPGAPFDLALRIDHQLSQPVTDGSRHASLPPDAEAWHQGLHSLEAASARSFGVPFLALDAPHQDGLLKQAAAGELGKGALGTLRLGESAHSFSAAQMKDWFEDVRGELTKIYISDPRTMSRVGFTGFADDHGFTQIELNQSEPFEAAEESAR